jgi:hypothetical protein
MEVRLFAQRDRRRQRGAEKESTARLPSGKGIGLRHRYSDYFVVVY